MNINLMCAVNQLGYGQVGLNVFKALERREDVTVALFPIGGIRQDSVPEEDLEVIGKGLKNAQFLDFDASCIRIWHQHDMSTFIGCGHRIGFPIFELDKFSDLEAHHLSNLDHMFVCSEWAQQIIQKELARPSDVVPLGVDLHEVDFPNYTDGPTKFFTCGKWEIRKGHDVLVQAFNEAFGDEDDVELHMMCTNPFLKPEQEQAWKDTYMDSDLGHKIRFVSRVKDHVDVIKTMNKMDAGVFISRAEGWNLELLEMMALGKPVIATNYSAHTEFCNEHNCYVVEVEETESAHDGIWFNGEGNWAKLGHEQITQTVNHMRNIHSKKSSRSGLQFDNIDGIDTGKRLSWDNTANEIVNHISNL